MLDEWSDRHPTGVIAWVLGSSVIWAAVIVSTGDIEWPLTVWALTTFAPIAHRHGAQRGSE